MNLAVERRWPFADLIAAAGLSHLPLTAVAERLGVDNAQVHRWLRDGMIPRAADEAATSLDLHPANVWPDFTEHPVGAPCGTSAAWHAHRKLGQRPCEACRLAQNRYQAEGRRRRAALKAAS